MGRRKRKPLPPDPVRVQVSRLAHDGRGVTQVEGKTVFIDGALPGEEIEFRYTRLHRHYDEGRIDKVIQPAPQRVEPRCPHFSVCGGCSLQHLAVDAQLAHKEAVLIDNLLRIGKVEPEKMLPRLQGPAWGYRRKARLGVRYVRAKHKVLVGFREKRNSFLADLTICPVLHPHVGEKIQDLSELIGSLKIYDRIAQIEVAVSEQYAVLVLRNLDPVDQQDQQRLIDFAKQHRVALCLQPKGPESVTPLWPEQHSLYYDLNDEGLRLHFLATDFTQVNWEINEAMVAQAMALLEVRDHESVLDLFCGLGNFTLPLARRAAEVVGIEGDAGLIERAQANAAHNHIDNVSFQVADLARVSQAGTGLMDCLSRSYDKVLLDPPRSGAEAILPALANCNPARIVYISCHPGSLARDAGVLVNQLGYTLTAVGVMDMFPHTSHVESIAVFEKPAQNR